MIGKIDKFRRARRAAVTARKSNPVTREAPRPAKETRAGPGNAASSVLLKLIRKSANSEEGYLSSDEFLAGCRLASDWERSSYPMFATTNWCNPSRVSSSAPAGSIDLEPGERQAHARGRVSLALRALGPTLSDVAIDVCCLDMMLGDLEIKWAWPARSGKVVVKLTLSQLDNHYRHGP